MPHEICTIKMHSKDLGETKAAAAAISVGSVGYAAYCSICGEQVPQATVAILYLLLMAAVAPCEVRPRRRLTTRRQGRANRLRTVTVRRRRTMMVTCVPLIE